MTVQIVNQRTGIALDQKFCDYVEAATYRRDVLRPRLAPDAPCPYAIRCPQLQDLDTPAPAANAPTLKPTSAGPHAPAGGILT